MGDDLENMGKGIKKLGKSAADATKKAAKMIVRFIPLPIKIAMVVALILVILLGGFTYVILDWNNNQGSKAKKAASTVPVVTADGVTMNFSVQELWDNTPIYRQYLSTVDELKKLLIAELITQGPRIDLDRPVGDIIQAPPTAAPSASGVVRGNIPLYMQTDSRWAARKWGDGTMGMPGQAYGCCPTSFAMVASAILGREVTPIEAIEWVGTNFEPYYLNGVRN